MFQITSQEALPVAVNGLSDIKAISCGFEHYMSLSKDGTIWAWGGNIYGQLGNGKTISSISPVMVSGLKDVVGISGGNRYSVAVKKDGTLWEWGIDLLKNKNDKGSNVFNKIPKQIEVK